MLQGAVIVFVIGALGGLGLASFVLRGQLAMWPLSILHALLGATGLVLTAIVLFGGGEGPVPANTGLALLLLVVAALGGFYLASYHLRNRPGPKPVVLIHAGVAAIGVVLLAGGAFRLF
jgi:uncharacterized SAM-binding protein YcdF (DUF218 family)